MRTTRYGAAAALVVVLVSSLFAVAPASAAVAPYRATATIPSSQLYTRCGNFPDTADSAKTINPVTDVQTPYTSTQLMQKRSDFSTATQSCTDVIVNDALDCRLSESTLKGSETEVRTALGRIADWFDSVLLPGAQTIAEVINTLPWVTTWASTTIIHTVHCKVHPSVNPVTGVRAWRGQFRVLKADGAITSLACQETRSSGSDLQRAGTFFPSMPWGGDLAFGCAEDVGSVLVDKLTAPTPRLCQVIINLRNTKGSGYDVLNLRTHPMTDSECEDEGSVVSTAPDNCCALPGWGTDDPPADWDNSTTGCELLTITSADNTENFFVEGDEVDFELSAIDGDKKPPTQGVIVTLVQGDPAENQSKALHWESSTAFSMVVKHKQGVSATTPRQLDYQTFYLFCADGSTAIRYYDMTGHGGGLTTNPSTGVDLSDCLSEAIGDFELTAPSTWVRGLLDGMKCLAEWLFVPPHPFDFYLTKWQTIAADTGAADLAEVASAPWALIGSVANGASAGTSSVTLGSESSLTGGKALQFPQIPSGVKSKITLLLTVLLLFEVVRRVLGILAPALGQGQLAGGAPAPSGDNSLNVHDVGEYGGNEGDLADRPTGWNGGTEADLYWDERDGW